MFIGCHCMGAGGGPGIETDMETAECVSPSGIGGGTTGFEFGVNTAFQFRCSGAFFGRQLGETEDNPQG